jgi:hypothetical protein
MGKHVTWTHYTDSILKQQSMGKHVTWTHYTDSILKQQSMGKHVTWTHYSDSIPASLCSCFLMLTGKYQFCSPFTK